jgi:hypothetical protein
MKTDVKFSEDVSALDRLRRLITGRFMCRPDGENTWIVSPLAWEYVAQTGVSIDPVTGRMPVDPEWVSYRRLDNWEWLIASNSELFEEFLTDLIHEASPTLEKFTGHLSAEEYRILLRYAGRGVYDFFVFDHRFGPPPRGREFRSNLRGEWQVKPHRTRPDNALSALRRRIDRLEARGEDATADREELARREALVRAGEDWRVDRD